MSKKKISIDFPYSTGIKTEQDAIDNFRKLHEPNSKEVKHWIAFTQSLAFVGMFIVGGAIAILLSAYRAPVWLTSCVILAMLGALLFMWAGIFDKRKG